MHNLLCIAPRRNIKLLLQEILSNRTYWKPGRRWQERCRVPRECEPRNSKVWKQLSSTNYIIMDLPVSCGLRSNIIKTWVRRQQTGAGVFVKHPHSKLINQESNNIVWMIIISLTGVHDVKNMLNNIKYIWSIMTWPEKPQYIWNLWIINNKSQ